LVADAVHAELPGEAILSFETGMAVKVRESVAESE
jgi:archaeosine-15-forming tRNA-guanine transglycosylase